MKNLVKISSVLLLVFLSNCASGITAAQKRESNSYKAKGLYVEEKKVGVAAALGILPGGGSFYTREYGIGVVNLLCWPLSILWDPFSGQRAAENINYYATKEHVANLQKQELKELNDMLLAGKIDTKSYIVRKSEIEERFAGN